jgi:2-iminobutanoate/2-iminopropanoate deaminase
MRRAAVSIVFTLLAAAPLAAQERQVVRLPGAAPQGLPFSPAVRAGNIVYLSGQIGFLPGTRQLASGGIAAETRQAMENIRRVLEASGSSFSRVLKCTVFLADIADYAAMNEVYATFFQADPPARSTIAASGLAFGARVEIECMAVTGA